MRSKGSNDNPDIGPGNLVSGRREFLAGAATLIGLTSVTATASAAARSNTIPDCSLPEESAQLLTPNLLVAVGPASATSTGSGITACRCGGPLFPCAI